jgi:hypothetical protein
MIFNGGSISIYIFHFPILLSGVNRAQEIRIGGRETGDRRLEQVEAAK